MGVVVWGLVGVVLTSLCYGIGTVLQAVAARRTPSSPGLDPGLLLRLFRQLPYLVGLLLDGVGLLASIVALRTLPLFLVESAIASSVGVTAVVAVRFLDARLRPPELVALLGLGAGLVLLAVCAEPGPGRPLPNAGGGGLLAGVGVVLALGLVAARVPRPWDGVGLAVASGAAFAGVGIAARVLELPEPVWHVVAAPTAWALAGFGLLGILFFAQALQRAAVTMVAAVTFGVETLLPAGVGLAVLGDRVRPGFGAVAVVAFALTLGCAMALARFAEPEHAPAPS